MSTDAHELAAAGPYERTSRERNNNDKNERSMDAWSSTNRPDLSRTLTIIPRLAINFNKDTALLAMVKV
jgi:hypothetical protein